MANYYDRLVHRNPLVGATGTDTKTGFALGSAYVYNSAGAAVGLRFVAPSTTTLTDIYFFVSAIAGTPGNLTVELRNVGAGTNLPGSTVIASTTVSPGTTANKWIHATLSSASVTIGNLYWIVVADAGWTTGNTATVLSRGGIASIDTTIAALRSATTSNGWTSSSLSLVPAMVLKFNDGTYLGSPYTTTASHASNSLARGIKLLGLTEQLQISGVLFATGGSALTGIKIFSGTTGPQGTADFSSPAFASQINGAGGVFFTPQALLKNTVYRIVLTITSSADPGYFQIEDNGTYTADLDACGLVGGNAYDTIDNGAGGWTDNVDRFPKMALIVHDQVAIAAGAGGPPLRPVSSMGRKW